MTTVVASLAETPSQMVVDGLERRADLIEARADLLGVDTALGLAERFGERLILTLRSREQGGEWVGEDAARRSLLHRGAVLGCTVDLELDRDDDPKLLKGIPEAQRLWSWHGPFAGVRRLRGRLSAMTALGGRWFKLVPSAGTQADVMAVLTWQATQAANVIGFAAGEAAGWSRILASRYAAGWVYLAVGQRTAAGQLDFERWFADGYAAAAQRPSRIFGVLGSPVEHSLSPRIHSAAYRALGLDFLYVPFSVADFADFWLDIVESEGWSELGCELTGMSVTAPHKRIALAVAGASSPLSAYVGAANTLVRKRGVWEAEITDPDGVRLPLEEKGVQLEGAAAAVVGAGGAGRGAVVALQQAGARVTVVNRSIERGTRVAERFEAPFLALSDFRAEDFEVVVHATPVGRDGADPPFTVEEMPVGSCIVEMVYRDPGRDVAAGSETELVRRARDRGLTVIEGREVLLAQALLQFRMMTGRDLPTAEAREALALGVEQDMG